MATVVMFATAREASGVATAAIPGDTVEVVLSAAIDRYGPRFASVLAHSRIWLNGEFAARSATTRVGIADEIAVIPAVAGG